MDLLPLLCLVSVALAGLTKGGNVLPAASLTKAVGDKVMFNTTVTPPENGFPMVMWSFNAKETPIITCIGTTNTTSPDYEGRITLFRSTGSLELRNLTYADTGEYKLLIVTHEAVRIHGSSSLKILVPVSPVAANATSTDLVEFNSSVSIRCFSSGSSPSFLWLNGSSEVTASDRVQVTDGNSTLTILNVNRHESGPYSCNASNAVSEDSSDPVELSISYGPENVTLTVSPSSEFHLEGSSVTLNCSAVSSPSANFTWFLNGEFMSDTGRELTLNNIQTNQSGDYVCQAFNSRTLRYERSQPSSVVIEKPTSSTLCPSGCIAGIVVACCVLCGGAVAVGFYLYTKKKPTRQTSTRAGTNGLDNSAYSNSQDLVYANIRFDKNEDGGAVRMGPEYKESEYAQIQVNRGTPPPPYEEYMQQKKRRAPQPGATQA